jgi:hypothetical protein
MGRAWGWALFSILLGCSKASSDASPEPVASATAESQPSATTIAVDDLPDDYAGRVTAQYAPLAPVQREMGIRQCIDKGDACHKGTLDGIIASAKSPKEAAHLNDVGGAEYISYAARGGTDGNEISGASVGLAGGLIANNPKLLAMIPTTSVPAAKKDTVAERGKVINTSGNVIEIAADHSTKTTIYEGSLMTDGGAIIRFYCPTSTDGIVDGTYARFRGVFIQEYDYPNVAGGQTKSLLLVGVFNP